MKITGIDLSVCERDSATMPPGRKLRFGVLSVTTDEGITGHNFAFRPGPDVLAQLGDIARAELIGQDPLDIGAIWGRIGSLRGADPCIQGILDVALWDIAGKAADLPVYRMLGAVRQKLPTYASSWVHTDPATYVEEALAYQAQGLRGYKLHPPTQWRKFTGEDVPVSADISVCAALREAVGPDYPLFLDSAWAYTYAEAVKVGRAIQDLDYVWYEDPLPVDDINGYLRLKQALHIPLMATELTGGGLTALAPWAAQRATDYLRGDVVLKGGITGMMKIAHLAEAFHLNCELHDAYDAMNNLATLHVGLAINNCEWFEIIAPHEPGSYDLEHLNMGLARPQEIDAEGYIHAPTDPGLGIAPDWDLLDNLRVGTR